MSSRRECLRKRRSMSLSTTMPPTSIPTSSSGSKDIGGLSSTSPRHPPPGSTPLRASLPSSQRSVSSAAYSDPYRNSKMPSTASSTTPTQTQNLLSGPRIPTRSSPLSNEGTKC